MAVLIITWLVIGLVVGGLGRLVIPGRNRIGLILTILIGVVGAVGGGAVTRALEGPGHSVLTFIIAVVIAAVLVGLISGTGRRR